MSNDKKDTTFFNGDPDMISAVAAAKAKKVPIGGVEMPSMPRFDQPPPNANSGVQSTRAAQKVLTPEQQRQLAEQGKFVQGVGSAYAANQPMLGSVTDAAGNEQPIDPRLAPRPPGSGLREETVAQLQAVAAVNAKKDDEELNKLTEEVNAIDEVYEDDEFGNRVRSLLENKARKESIEKRCPPMSFEDLLMTGSVTQRVPIIPGKFEPTFRSLQGDENEEILRLMGAVRGPDQYVLDVLSLFNLTAGLYSINNKILPNHLNTNGDFDEEMFRAKHKMVRRMALPILADLSVNFRWFARRVQKLTVVDDIKSF